MGKGQQKREEEGKAKTRKVHAWCRRRKREEKSGGGNSSLWGAFSFSFGCGARGHWLFSWQTFFLLLKQKSIFSSLYSIFILESCCTTFLLCCVVLRREACESLRVRPARCLDTLSRVYNAASSQSGQKGAMKSSIVRYIRHTKIQASEIMRIASLVARARGAYSG